MDRFIQSLIAMCLHYLLSIAVYSICHSPIYWLLFHFKTIFIMDRAVAAGKLSLYCVRVLHAKTRCALT
jgi:hypothetical protein